MVILVWFDYRIKEWSLLLLLNVNPGCIPVTLFTEEFSYSYERVELPLSVRPSFINLYDPIHNLSLLVFYDTLYFFSKFGDMSSVPLELPFHSKLDQIVPIRL